MISGLTAPALLRPIGPGSWRIVWAALAAISTVLTAVLMLNRVEAPALRSHAAARTPPLAPIAIYLFGYFCFGAGYIAYMTFMIAYVRSAGGGALAQSAFWCLIGAGALVSPWLWRGLLSRGASGGATAILIGITMIGAALPLVSATSITLALSALVFGLAFFAVVSATTAFVRFNYPAEAWPKAIAAVTIAFSIGQTLGPIASRRAQRRLRQPGLCARPVGADAGAGRRRLRRAAAACCFLSGAARRRYSTTAQAMRPPALPVGSVL